MKAILLVPSDAFREALLGDGPCGAAVPMAHAIADGPVWTPGPYEAGDWGPDLSRLARCALVLAWDGAVVREGRDRAAYALLDAAGIDPGSATAAAIWRGVHTAAWNMHMLDALGIELTDDRHACIHAGRSIEERLATVCAARGLGTVVVVP
jgi:hypothetical protein